MPFTSNRKLLAILVSASLGIVSALTPALTSAAEPHTYNIPAGKLDAVLNQFAVAAGIEFYLNAALSEEMYSQGLSGVYQPDEALRLLLSNTGLNAQLQADGTYRLSPKTNSMMLDPIQVRTNFDSGISRDEAGEMAIYDDDVSSAYMGKDEIERFKGASASDLFKGMANIFSGEARNGGGSIDPNIRGVQGPGRVPVIIDGTEQGISVYNGYRGASNRNYIDPNLIGSMKVYKGAQINPDITTSVGGAVEVSTISVQDIVPEGETFGMEFIAESSSNSVAPHQARLHTGKDWRDVPAYVDLGGVPLYDDPELRFQSRSERDNNPLRGEDVAYRLAMSGISSKFEWLGAYAYRKRGNYFSGKKQADFYQQPYQGGRGFLIAGRNPFLQPEHIALNHYPGDEIPNTSSKMESALLKTTFNISDFYKLQFNARYTQSTHGEILASRSDYRNQDGLPQWPLARADMQAYSIKFRADPVNKFIDLSTNIWVTLTDSKTNTGYGFPNFTYRKSETPNIIMNTSEVNRKENRFGFSFKNKMLLTDNLDVTLSGSYQNHELVPKEGLQQMIDFYGGAVRAGEREEYNGAVTMEWRPRDFLIINAGVRYGSYKAIDSYIKNRVDAGDLKMLSESRGLGYRLRFQTNETYVEEEIEQNVANAEHSVRSTFTRVALLAQITRLRNLIVMFPSESEEYQSQLVGHQSELNNFDTLLAAKIAEKVTAAQNQTAYVADHTSEWLADSDNHYTLANNACAAALNNPHYIVGSCKVGVIEGESVSNTRYQLSGSGWMPSLTTTLLFNDNSRAYVRYAETLRFPSLFESTSGFSAIPSYSAPLEPERAKLFEVAYIHYFEHSSVKLTYFSQNIEDVMDRDRNEMSFTNLDKQRTSGLELQGVYDNQIYFGDIAMAYSLSNEVCDETSAGQKFIADIIDDQPTSMATCIRGGFSQGSYLAAHAAPEWSASLLLGSRFFNQQLEMAVRTNYVSGNDDDEVIKRNDVTTVDAYAKYNFNKYIEVEFVGTNLTDIYYLESGSVSGMASPGRTVSLKLRGRF